MCLRTNSSTDIQARIIKNSLTNHDLYTKVRAGLGGMRIDACSYSCRNISAGSSDDARMAGRMAAEAAIRKNSPAMLTKVKGSAGLVPTKMALINRVRTKPPARPMLSPISINRNPFVQHKFENLALLSTESDTDADFGCSLPNS